jgi:hypothetical protein
MFPYKTAYELELDALDLQLCLDTDDNQHDYEGSRKTDEVAEDSGPPPQTTTP